MEGVALGYYEQGNAFWLGATSEARLCYYSERTKRMSEVGFREVCKGAGVVARGGCASSARNLRSMCVAAAAILIAAPLAC